MRKMPTVGETLKQRRLERNLSLDEVAEVTKIGVFFLQALESNEFKKLPRGAFPKMFVRSYARYLGLDDDKVVQMFYEQLAAAEAVPESFAAVSAPTSRSMRKSRRTVQGIAAIAILLALSVSAYLVYQAQESGVAEGNSSGQASPKPPPRWTPPEPKPSPPTAPGAGAPAAETAAGQSLPADGAAAAPLGPAGFGLRLHAHDYCWVRITRGEAEQYDFILKPGDSFARDFDGAITLKLGNAGGVDLSLNNQPTAPLGLRGEVVTVTLARENILQYLQKPREP
jgi:cytoskeleton protein RodZ